PQKSRRSTSPQEQQLAIAQDPGANSPSPNRVILTLSDAKGQTKLTNPCHSERSEEPPHLLLLLPLHFLLQPPGCPILRALAKGGNVNCSMGGSLRSSQGCPILRAFAKGGI